MSAGRVLLYGAGGFIVVTVATRFGLSTRWESVYAAAGKKWGVSPELLHAIALQESRENPTLVSPPNTNGTRDYGLMQINESNLARFGLTPVTVLDGPTCVDAAAHLLAENDAAAPGMMPWDKFSIYNAGFAPGTNLPRTNKAGVYVDLAYVLATTAWWLAVYAAELSIIKRTA